MALNCGWNPWKLQVRVTQLPLPTKRTVQIRVAGPENLQHLEDLGHIQGRPPGTGDRSPICDLHQVLTASWVA